MNTVRFEPWSVFDQLHRNLGRPVLRPLPKPSKDGVRFDWIPAVDIVEHRDRFVVHADVPGVNPAAIDVNMEDGVLSIAGERLTDDHDDIEGVQRIERKSGRFERRFTLPETSDADGITARCANGILEISIPKQPELQPRRITVEAA